MGIGIIHLSIGLRTSFGLLGARLSLLQLRVWLISCDIVGLPRLSLFWISFGLFCLFVCFSFNPYMASLAVQRIMHAC